MMESLPDLDSLPLAVALPSSTPATARRVGGYPDD